MKLEIGKYYKIMWKIKGGSISYYVKVLENDVVYPSINLYTFLYTCSVMGSYINIFGNRDGTCGKCTWDLSKKFISNHIKEIKEKEFLDIYRVNVL